MRTKSGILTVACALLLSVSIAIAQGGAKQIQITNGPTVENVDSNSATIAWSTNVNASTSLKYGTDPNKLDQTKEAPWGGLTHRVKIENLQPDTTYHFQVTSGQAQGTGTTMIGNVSQFKTKPAGASAQSAGAQQQSQGGGGSKVVAGPIAQNRTDTSADIWWVTEGQTDSIVKYGTSPSDLNQTAQQPYGGPTHKVTLSGLQPDTTYHLSLVDKNGNVLQSGVQFKTRAQNYAQTEKFQLTNGPVVERISDREATVAWSTNAASSSVVRYGADPNSLNQTAQAPWGAGENTHRVTLKNLQPNTKYWVRVESAQARGTGASRETGLFPIQTLSTGSAALSPK